MFLGTSTVTSRAIVTGLIESGVASHVVLMTKGLGRFAYHEAQRLRVPVSRHYADELTFGTAAHDVACVQIAALQKIDLAIAVRPSERDQRIIAKLKSLGVRTAVCRILPGNREACWQ